MGVSLECAQPHLPAQLQPAEVPLGKMIPPAVFSRFPAHPAAILNVLLSLNGVAAH
jgi:hypothetical protein